MRKVPLPLVVGGADHETWEITQARRQVSHDNLKAVGRVKDFFLDVLQDRVS